MDILKDDRLSSYFFHKSAREQRHSLVAIPKKHRDIGKIKRLGVLINIIVTCEESFRYLCEQFPETIYFNEDNNFTDKQTHTIQLQKHDFFILLKNDNYNVFLNRFYLSDIITLNNTKFLSFIDDKNLVQNQKTITHLCIMGIGDLLLLLPIYFYKSRNAKTINFIISNPNYIYIIRMFFPTTKKMNFLGISEIFDAQIFNKIDIENINENYNLDFYEENVIREVDEDPHVVFQNYKRLLLIQPYDTSNYIKKHRYVIGFQRCSGTFDDHDNSLCKYWDIDECKKFIMMCKERDIAVINLEPTEKYKSIYTYDFSHLNIHRAFKMLKNCDAFVGIDSCFCHACSLLDIPSVAIYATNSVKFRSTCLRYMPLSNNYALIPSKDGVASIKAEHVFSILMDILERRKVLSSNYTTLRDRTENIHYEIVE